MWKEYYHSLIIRSASELVSSHSVVTCLHAVLMSGHTPSINGCTSLLQTLASHRVIACSVCLYTFEWVGLHALCLCVTVKCTYCGIHTLSACYIKSGLHAEFFFADGKKKNSIFSSAWIRKPVQARHKYFSHLNLVFYFTHLSLLFFLFCTK